MTKKEAIKIFEEKKVRTVWDDETEEWYFSVIDIIAVLTDSSNPTDYFKKMRKRDEQLALFVGTNCPQITMMTETGKKRKTLAADTQAVFRIIQSIPSPKAEPFKLWMAQVAKERLDQMQDPELSIDQAMTDYKRLGYSDNWINQRLKSIEIRKDLTDENLRDNMTNTELVLNMLAELSTKQIEEVSDPDTFNDHIDIAKQGGEVARNARLELEAKTGRKVVSPLNAKTGLRLNKKNENDEVDE